MRATNGLWVSRLVCTITLVIISLLLQYHLCFSVASFIILWNARLPSPWALFKSNHINRKFCAGLEKW